MAKSKLTNVAIASPFGKAHPKQEAYELNSWTQQESLIIIIHFLGIVLDISAPASIRISLVWFNSEEIYSSEGTTESESWWAPVPWDGIFMNFLASLVEG